MLPEIQESRRLYPLKTIHICAIRRLDENSLASAVYKFSKINIQSRNQLVKASSGMRDVEKALAAGGKLEMGVAVCRAATAEEASEPRTVMKRSGKKGGNTFAAC